MNFFTPIHSLHIDIKNLHHQQSQFDLNRQKQHLKATKRFQAYLKQEKWKTWKIGHMKKSQEPK